MSIIQIWTDITNIDFLNHPNVRWFRVKPLCIARRLPHQRTRRPTWAEALQDGGGDWKNKASPLFSDWRRDMGRNAPKTFVIVISMPSYDPHGFIETFAFFYLNASLVPQLDLGEHCTLRGSLSDSACPCSMAGKVCHIFCGHICWKGINANGAQQSWISTMPTSRFPKIASFRSFRLQRLTVSVRIWYSYINSHWKVVGSCLLLKKHSKTQICVEIGSWYQLGYDRWGNIDQLQREHRKPGRDQGKRWTCVAQV